VQIENGTIRIASPSASSRPSGGLSPAGSEKSNSTSGARAASARPATAKEATASAIVAELTTCARRRGSWCSK